MNKQVSRVGEVEFYEKNIKNVTRNTYDCNMNNSFRSNTEMALLCCAAVCVSAYVYVFV